MTKASLIDEAVLSELPRFAGGADGADRVKDICAAIPRLTNTTGDILLSGPDVVTLFENLSAEKHDPAFGIRYAETLPLGTSGALGYLVTNAKDMRSAVKAIARYKGLIVTDLDATFSENNDGGTLTWRFPASYPATHQQFNSFLAALAILRLRLGLSPDWSPKLVQFTHREPADISAYKRVFGPNIAFQQSVNRFTFRSTNLVRENPRADSNLFQTVKRLGDILIAARIPSNDFKSQIVNEIIDHLGVVPPTLDAIAEEMRVGTRTIQRRLAGEGTTFETVVGEARRSVAERLLRDTDLSMTDIAFMLGFSELSAFTRACNRWFGTAPREFRHRVREKA